MLLKLKFYLAFTETALNLLYKIFGFDIILRYMFSGWIF